MQDENTSVPEMFQEYAQFKYDIYKWRLETNFKNQLFNPLGTKIDDENDIGEKLKYDLGTPIFLNTLANKIHNKMVDATFALSGKDDPREMNSPYESLWQTQLRQEEQKVVEPQESLVSKMLGSMQEHLLVTPKSQVNYLLERMQSDENFLQRVRQVEENR